MNLECWLFLKHGLNVEAIGAIQSNRADGALVTKASPSGGQEFQRAHVTPCIQTIPQSLNTAKP